MLGDDIEIFLEGPFPMGLAIIAEVLLLAKAGDEGLP
jgi:hypothetical protein